jgi:hypothetical protein
LGVGKGLILSVIAGSVRPSTCATPPRIFLIGSHQPSFLLPDPAIVSRDCARNVSDALAGDSEAGF